MKTRHLLHLRTTLMNTTQIKGKVVVVTGASRGIGLSIAKAVARAGASLAVCSRSQSSVDKAIQELSEMNKVEVMGHAVDVGNSDSVKKFFEAVEERFKGVDVLINNAGVGMFRAVADLTIEDWQSTLNTNLSG